MDSSEVVPEVFYTLHPEQLDVQLLWMQGPLGFGGVAPDYAIFLPFEFTLTNQNLPWQLTFIFP